MTMSLDRLINLLVTITLIEMMVLIGLRVTFAELIEIGRSFRLVTRAAVANYLLVPTLAVALLILFEADPMVAAGFLVLAACPGAPFGPPFAGIARANVPEAVGLMVILAGSSAIVSPLLLTALLPSVRHSAERIIWSAWWAPC
jgi:BASS family bile acid:Na+ symporter